MGWGEPHLDSAETTGDIEAAHKALDGVQIAKGSLARRAVWAAEAMLILRSNLKLTSEKLSALQERLPDGD